MKPFRSVVLVVCVVVSACRGDARLTQAQARQLLSDSPRFREPYVLHVRSRVCSNRIEREAAARDGLDPGRLKALQDKLVITTAVGPAQAGECQGVPSAQREVIVIALGPGAATFHPKAVEGGWEFTLATRRFVGIQSLTFNRDDDPVLAHVVYQWAWSPELLGQLLQLSETPQGAQATFIREGGGWQVRTSGV